MSQLSDADAAAIRSFVQGHQFEVDCVTTVGGFTSIGRRSAPSIPGIAGLERCRTSLGTDDQHRSFVHILRTICGLPDIISAQDPTHIGAHPPSLAWMLPHCGLADRRLPPADVALRGRISGR